MYYELLVDCKLDDKLLINNNPLKIRFKTGTTTFIKEWIRKIKKGMNQ